MVKRSRPSNIEVTTTEQATVVAFNGDLRTHHLSPVENYLADNLSLITTPSITFDTTHVEAFDTGSGLMLLMFQTMLQSAGHTVTIAGLNADQQAIIDTVKQYRCDPCEASEHPKLPFLENLGKNSVDTVANSTQVLDFIGRITMMILSYVQSIKNVRMKEILFEINESVIKAFPIIALTTFLIGIVVAYQSSVQLKLYGANIFIVDMLGVGIFREMAPLIAAIVIAGRSGSAYAAQIGVMKMTEELDAMRTMGFDPYAFLVMPRLITLTLMMPIIVFFADMMGILGGMLIAHTDLGLSVEFFLERFQQVVAIKHFWVGMIKAPFFGILIAMIGIYRGMYVKDDSQSIGFNTTKSVVEAIFAVIICDAVFSIIFMNVGM